MLLLLLNIWHALDINMLKLRNITITSPKKVVKGELAGSETYFCEVYLSDREKKYHPIYAGSPIEATDNANKFVGAYLQQKINRIEELLKEKDIKQRLAEELEWAKQELVKHSKNQATH
jgi:hypothetical protein